MKLDNNELYAILCCIDYVDDHDVELDDYGDEYLQVVRNKVARLMEVQAQYDLECG
tara:strand:+ start:694 stop:861 length:168 start_codon:yes stop_codon:yes gene_type:complete